jgi:hypothetical protein
MKYLNELIKRGLLVTLFLSATGLNATTRSDVNLLEASEDIRFISQKIVKEYFYLAQSRQKESVLEYIHKDISLLDDRLRSIAAATKSDDTKNILTFLVYSRDQINETIEQPYDIDNASLMLDYSEALLEGAESIALEHSYQFSNEEKMLIDVKKMRYLVERITKYYMTFQLGISDVNNIKQLQDAIAAFDTAMYKLNLYNYSQENAQALHSLNIFWPVVRKFYLDFEQYKLSNILYISAQNLETELRVLELYHSQNL